MKINPTDPTWLALRAHISTEIDRLRTALEDHNSTDAQTQQLRGCIMALRSLLRTIEPKHSEAPPAPVTYDQFITVD